jgi:hypothetical protein
LLFSLSLTGCFNSSILSSSSDILFLLCSILLPRLSMEYFILDMELSFPEFHFDFFQDFYILLNSFFIYHSLSLFHSTIYLNFT